MVCLTVAFARYFPGCCDVACPLPLLGPDTLIDDCITKLDRRRLKRLHSQDGVTRLSPENDDGGQTDSQR
jgi:hypothetical protein